MQGFSPKKHRKLTKRENLALAAQHAQDVARYWKLTALEFYGMWARGEPYLIGNTKGEMFTEEERKWALEDPSTRKKVG